MAGPSTPPDRGRQGPAPSERLDSWKEIATYLNRDIRTLQRWEQTKGLPVHRLPGGKLPRIFALKSELDAWWNSRGIHLLEEEEAWPAGPKVRKRGRRRLLWAAAAMGLVGVAVATWQLLQTRSAPAPLLVSPLTSYSGGMMYPSFSPDGREVVFSWNGEKQDNYDLYVKLIGAGEPQRLTKDPAVDSWAAWSPDGRYIAFGRWRPGRPGVQSLLMPARGGPERLLGETPYGQIWPIPAMSWTPDSRWVVSGAVEPPAGLFLFSPETWERRRLTTAPPTSLGDHSPVISPDGRKVAFLRHLGAAQANVFLLDLNPDYTPRGQPRQLTHEPCCASNPMWTGDGREILYVKYGEETTTLFRLPTDGSGRPQPVSSLGEVGSQLSISRKGDKLVYVGGSADSEIWRAELPGRDQRGGLPLSARRFASSTRIDRSPQISPDGKKVAFVSSRSGKLEVWVAEADGSNALQATSLRGPVPEGPRWSPDGNQIAFHANVDGNEDLYIVSAAGGKPRRLTKGAGNNMYPSWSRDGKWVWFTSNRGGDFQCWKVSSGGGDAVQVTKGGGFGGFESADGGFLYYAKSYVSGDIWRVPVAGGEEQPVHESVLSLRGPANFAVTAEGIYTASSADPLRGFDLQFYRFATGKVEPVGRITVSLAAGLAVSPDGHWLLFADQPARRGDLTLVENFR